MRLRLSSHRWALDFLKKYSLKVVGIISSILVVVISLYSLFCTAYSDVIVQNDNDFFGLPEQSLSEKEIETTFNQLIGKEATHKNLFIFVLDISGSIQNSSLEKTAYNKYKDGVEAVNNRFGGGILTLKNRNDMNIFDFAKTRLYTLLLALLQKNGDESKGEFAVWTLGDEAVKIYPDGRKTNVTENSIKNAIIEISRPRNDAGSNTNFVSLFYRLKSVYARELSRKQLEPFESPNFIITILSDLIHDVEKRYNVRSKELKENWNELKEEIQGICNSRIMANMIVFSEKDPDIRRSIFSLFKENIEWYRLNKLLIGKKENDICLFTVRTTRENIKFYYQNPNSISESKFTIRYTGSKSSKIKIGIPSKVDKHFSQKITLSCRQINAKNEPLGDEHRITTGGSEYTIELGKNQKIRLSFTGRLPESVSSPVLRISLNDEGRTYLVPIEFIKRLPDWAAGFFITLKNIFWWVLWIGLILVLARLSVFLLFTFGVKENEPGKPEENGPGEAGMPETENDPSEPAIDPDLININTASLSKLKILKGINAKLARKIRENRPFEKSDDLKTVLGKDIFRKIREQICV